MNYRLPYDSTSVEELEETFKTILDSLEPKESPHSENEISSQSIGRDSFLKLLQTAGNFCHCDIFDELISVNFVNDAEKKNRSKNINMLFLINLSIYRRNIYYLHLIPENRFICKLFSIPFKSRCLLNFR